MATPRADLERLTAPKLRELAIEKYPDLTGVSGMKKEELVEAIIQEEVRQGLRPKEEPKARATSTMGAVQLKAEIRKVRVQRDTALENKDGAAAGHARLQIKRMKRRLRKLREAAVS
ncbi:MAG TPA: Rho termination factor N-terminal domain-containing protein [Candidatus Sulfotelmatobacter sp.]|nr:Rho termination factor N-terminal domain-containing protein [Candidatus Sulfotelmatobacter sp.]